MAELTAAYSPLTGVLLSALAWDFWSFALFRIVGSLGPALQSAQTLNLSSANLGDRGRIDLVVNGSFWLGAAAGALAAPVSLDQNLLPVNVGWRLGFGIGGVLGFSILMLRRFVPKVRDGLLLTAAATKRKRQSNGSRPTL